MNSKTWRYLRDDVWTYLALIVFVIGCVGLVLPKILQNAPEGYGFVVLILGGVLLLFRLLKISLLLCFGKSLRIEKFSVENRKAGVCIVHYSYATRDFSLYGEKQIYFRDGDLEVLYLNSWPELHLVAWQEKEW
ncbi:MAG: hypothetical protein AAF483_20460 [Planctomycetota bacterium]